ncbi:hypothetical protein F4680DRAFT_454283 [Xylaria scruposa]|nr:hypothetical protein F4680DRAFT_454283 [Xylaria scruposa]
MSSFMEKSLAELDAIKKTWKDEQKRFITEMGNAFQHHVDLKNQLLSREIEMKESMAKEALSQASESLERRNDVRLPAAYCWSISQANITVRIDETPQDLTVPDFCPSSVYRPAVLGDSHSQASTMSAPPKNTTGADTAPIAPRGPCSTRGTVMETPTLKPRERQGGRVLSQAFPIPRKTPLMPRPFNFKFTEKPNIDFAEVQSEHLWVFECKVLATYQHKWYYLTMKCPADCKCPVFSKNPMCEGRGANHLKQCGMAFEDEYDMLRKYARIVVSKHPATREDVKKHNSTLLASNEAELEKENLM